MVSLIGSLICIRMYPEMDGDAKKIDANSPWQHGWIESRARAGPLARPEVFGPGILFGDFLKACEETQRYGIIVSE